MQVIPEGEGPVIPEGEGPVKTNGGVVLVRSTSCLVLAGRVEIGVGVKARAEPDRVAAAGALTATPFGACCSGQGDREGLCCFRVCSGGGALSSSGPGFPARGRRIGLPVIPSPRVGGMKRFAGYGRSGSIRGSDLAGSGVMTCAIRADRGLCAHAARGERCRARTW